MHGKFINAIVFILLFKDEEMAPVYYNDIIMIIIIAVKCCLNDEGKCCESWIIIKCA